MTRDSSSGGSASEPLPPTVLTAVDKRIALALFATVILLASLRITPGVVGTYHDDAIYVSTAQALAEGRGYRLIGLPGEPFQTKYPVLYPAVLSSLWVLWPAFPANLVLLQCLSIVCTACSVAGSYLFLVRFNYGRRLECALSCAVAATASSVLYFASQTLSEPFFAVALLASLWMVERAKAGAGRPGAGFLLGASIATPMLARTIGLATGVAAAWSLLRSRALVASVVAGAVVVSSIWGLWVVTHAGGPAAEAAAYYTVQSYVGWWFYASANVLWLNVLLLLFGTGQLPAEVILTGAVWPVPVVLGFAAWASIGVAATRGSALGITLLTYAALVVIWPWPPYRFLVPVLPFLTLYCVRACGPLLRRFPSRTRTILAGAVVCVIVTSNLGLLVRLARIARSTGYPYYIVLPERLVSWRHYQQVFVWIREHTAPTDVLASGLDSMVALFTNRHAIRPFTIRPTALFYDTDEPPVGTVDDLTGALRLFEVRYVVDLPMPGFAEEKPLQAILAAAISRYPGCLTEVYRLDADRRFGVYAVHLPACRDKF